MTKKRYEGKYAWTADEVEWSQCLYCEHIKPHTVCEAFPEGIPEQIQDNKFLHSEPYPGDHGIRLEVKPKLKEEFAELLEQIRKDRMK